MRHPLKRHEKARLIYEELRQKILTMDFIPGLVLVPRALAEHYSVSVAPVREALLSLQLDGLVDIRPQSRTSISLISLSSLQSAYILRLALETEVTYSLARSSAAIDLAKAQEAVDIHSAAVSSGSFEASRHAGRLFHDALFHAAGYSGLSLLLNHRTSVVRRVEPLWRSPAEEEIIQVHGDILHNITRGNSQRAIEIMRQHIDPVLDEINLIIEKYPHYFKP